MVAATLASRLGDFLPGLAIGVVVGLLLARAFWSWIAWRQWRDASSEADRRAARLADEVLQRMEQDVARQIDSSEPPLNG